MLPFRNSSMVRSSSKGARARGVWGVRPTKEEGRTRACVSPQGVLATKEGASTLRGCHGELKASRGLHPLKSAAFQWKTTLLELMKGGT